MVDEQGIEPWIYACKAYVFPIKLQALMVGVEGIKPSSIW